MTNGNTAAARSSGIATAGNDAIEILMNDHQVVKSLLEQLAGSNADERATVLEQLKAVLTVHNATEENLVYPTIRFVAARPRDAETLYHQQDEAEAALWSIDATIKGVLDGDDADDQIKTLQKAVLAHVRKEEETEFPHLREALKGSALRQLTDDVREFRSKFNFAGPKGR
jgi:hemerythrin superfamily protein